MLVKISKEKTKQKQVGEEKQNQKERVILSKKKDICQVFYK
jgi:hypothetical protein